MNDDDLPSPRAATLLFGHADAEAEFLSAYRGGRLPHAWLISGPDGVGKATFAYRLARFILAHPDARLPRVQDATSLVIAADDPVARRIAAQGHSDLMVLERTEGDNGKLRTVITVDQVRRTTSFFGSTAGEGGWRICIIDTADDLQFPQATNALLKIIEEPPARSLFLLLSATPGRLLPTIRSRCRRLALHPLSTDEMRHGVGALLGNAAGTAEIDAAVQAAGGSIGRALALLDGNALALRGKVSALLAKLPAVPAEALHALGDEMSGTDSERLETFVATVRDWLSTRLSAFAGQPARLAQVAEVWDKVTRAARDAEIYNLDRKPLVFSVFGLLAETAR